MELEKIKLNDGSYMPKMGQGTWNMGEKLEKEEEEIENIYQGVMMGMTMIDTAEMYADGNAETIVGKALKKAMKHVPREKIYIISKVYPFNAGRRHIFQSCEDSLRRLGVSYLDMYLLHWRGNIPLRETVECMELLKKQKKIRRWGVSNFDYSDMEELLALPNGDQCMVNQVLYHIGCRGIEHSLIPFQNKYGIPIIAYSPVAQAGKLLRQRDLNSRKKVIMELAEKYNATFCQILLAFVMYNPNVIAIPKSSNLEHLKENFEVYEKKIVLTPEDIEILNEEFPPPNRRTPLQMA